MKLKKDSNSKKILIIFGKNNETIFMDNLSKIFLGCFLAEIKRS